MPVSCCASGVLRCQETNAVALRMPSLHVLKRCRDFAHASTMLRKLLGRGGERRLPQGVQVDPYARLAYGNLMLDTLPDRKKEEGNSKALDLLQRVSRAFFQEQEKRRRKEEEGQ